MNKLEKILGIKFPEDTKISFASNFSHKIKKIQFFLDYLVLKIMAVNIVKELLIWVHHWLFIMTLITKMKI